MNSVESFPSGYSHSIQEYFRHSLPVLPCKSLADLNIVKIVVQILPFQPAEIFRYIGAVLSCFTGQLLECRLNFFLSSLFFKSLNNLLPLLFQFSNALMKVNYKPCSFFL